ncbi:excalibur calcium-binding domain-containing protein [Thiovibrio frasassiensis]|uniref:Excalibur calcium-binding domain-containing protein n=1 Tax=Thiovibrio frasassiensis TaxID=2984131 RepID=A0A9X4RMM4_9BACT|nr:excalibur calcium-binding domain-containing protein [Thiovibrio frasassiensis]MDG4476510.1 excalibur calcium-binding domain-containing protein [Thiovibrio frasassiensis]
MKKILLFAIAIAIGWSIYHNDIGPKNAYMGAEGTPTVAKSSQHPSKKESFTCDGRQHCSQMTSRAEAKFFVQNCPDTKMDGDHDGIPCENDSRF